MKSCHRRDYRIWKLTSNVWYCKLQNTREMHGCSFVQNFLGKKFSLFIIKKSGFAYKLMDVYTCS